MSQRPCAILASVLALAGATTGVAPFDAFGIVVRECRIPARAAQARGAWIDPALALPLYVRDKVAQTTAEREAIKLAQAMGGA